MEERKTSTVSVCENSEQIACTSMHSFAGLIYSPFYECKKSYLDPEQDAPLSKLVFRALFLFLGC